MAGNDTKSTLLCHWNGPDGAKEIVDDGATGHIITQVGTATTSTAQKKIGNCSLLLDGDSDYLTIPDHADWNFGSGSHTIEAWVYLSAFASGVSYALFNQRVNATSLHDIYLLNNSGTAQIAWRIRSGGNLDITVNSSGISTGQWYHFAFVAQGNNDRRIYQDGVQQGATNTTAKDAPDLAAQIGIGEIAEGSLLNGYIDEYRISNSARYTANFTASTTAFTSDANTKLLLHMESHNIGIGGSYGPATFIATAQLDTAVKTFGTASLLLDGDSDVVTFPDSTDWDLGNTFTIDLRVRMPALPTNGNNYDVMAQWMGAGDDRAWRIFLLNTSGTYSWNFAYTTDGALGTYTIISKDSPGLSVNTWYHLAVVRDTNSLYIFQDGTQVGTAGDMTGVNIYNSSQVLGIGALTAGGTPSNYYNGYIDELRISSIARWTANFTPPSAEYSEDTPAPSASTRRIFVIT